MVEVEEFIFGRDYTVNYTVKGISLKSQNYFYPHEGGNKVEEFWEEEDVKYEWDTTE